MRPIEAIVLSALAATLILVAIPWSKRPRWLRIWPLVLLIVLLLQVLMEGYRWQMVPAYILGGIAFLAGLPSMLRGHQATDRLRWIRRFLAIVVALIGLVVVWVAVELTVQVPSFKMPPPSGPHTVGTRTFQLVDESRTDEDSPIANGYRSMSIQLWYPAELSGGEERTTYMRPDIRKEMEALAGTPAWFNGYRDQVRTYAYWNARVDHSGERYPVIIYSPSGNASLHKILFEELASRGYLVVSISHPHWTNVIFDDQGNVIEQGGVGERYQAWFREADLSAVRNAQGQINSHSNFRTLEQAQITLNNARPIAIFELRQWAQDVGFVLDQLAQMNEPGEFFDDRLELSRVGVMGFSLGGATAGQFCVTDERCQAGINVDGFMFGDILDNNLTVPFMFFHSSFPGEEPVGALFYEWAEDSAYIVQIAGANHHDLGAPAPTGRPILVPMEINSGQFPDGAYLARIMNDYVSAFFDKHLKNEAVPLLDGHPPYPEVMFMAKDGN
jgi:predicted dienelactone hydrolase